MFSPPQLGLQTTSAKLHACGRHDAVSCLRVIRARSWDDSSSARSGTATKAAARRAMEDHITGTVPIINTEARAAGW